MRVGKRLVVVVGVLCVSVLVVSGQVAWGFSPYQDVPADHYAEEQIAALSDAGVFEGTDCGEGLFCPDAPILRSTMAVWMVRILDGGAAPPAATGDRFDDVAASDRWAAYIERFAELGVTAGCGDGTRFCGDEATSRGQMATFLVRAFSLDEASPFGFGDTVGSAHEASIDALAAAGVTKGCAVGPARFCPSEVTSRAQMAAFIGRAIDRSSIAVGLESASGRVVAGSFNVGITFAREVTGFDAGDVVVVNGRVGGLSGSGSVYEMKVVPAEVGSVVVWIPAGAVRDTAGIGNQGSGVLVRTFVADISRDGPGFDVWDRAAVVAAYSGEFGRAEPEWGYTGDVAECVAGTTSQEFRDSVVQRVNWYRQMGGLDPVTESPALSATAQHKALIVLAEGRVSHSPSPDWACYRRIEEPRGENLGLGTAGVWGVDEYIRDTGDHNLAVGHRLQVLSPFAAEIGTGNVRTSGRYALANAMHLRYDFDLDPTVREERGFVAWPPAGYVPAGVVWGRWSFSKQWIQTEVTRSGNVTYTRWFLTEPDFSNASVSVTLDDGPVEAVIIHRDTALVWAMEGDTGSDLLDEPTGGDRCYKVTISGVRENGAVEVPYEYAVCVVGPEA